MCVLGSHSKIIEPVVINYYDNNLEKSEREIINWPKPQAIIITWRGHTHRYKYTLDQHQQGQGQGEYLKTCRLLSPIDSRLSNPLVHYPQIGISAADFDRLCLIGRAFFAQRYCYYVMN